jgi:formylglycine-generating enzyme required for sulfatase activity
MARGNTDGLRVGAHGSTLAAMALCAGAALASPPPDYDFDWATIGRPGNRAYDREDPFGLVAGRGSVPYRFRISRLEVTTAQWLEFVNTFSTQDVDDGFAFVPQFWGAQFDPDYAGPGIRWRLIASVPNADRVALGGVSWQWAARYCNWLHNGKSSDLASLDTGAYDASTFSGTFDPPPLTDGDAHLPGAKFWIPTVDEHLKAAYYDPRQDYWWLQPNGSDDFIPDDQTSADDRARPTDENWLRFPLGLYPDTRSPWGLLDLSGGGQEWNEDWYRLETRAERVLRGSSIGLGPGAQNVLEFSYSVGSGSPQERRYGETSFRVAGVVPGMPTLSIPVVVFGSTRRRRKPCVRVDCGACSRSLC